MKITRREFVQGAALTLTSAVVVGSGFDLMVGEAQAQTASQADLMKAGPFEEMVLGAENAPVTIIAYVSTTCSHCASFENNTFPELKKRYIDTGKVRFISREYVLNQLDAGAVMLLRCASKDKYFPLLEVLFLKQEQWAFVQQPLPALLSIAKQAGFTESAFEKCLSNQKLLEDIESVRRHATEKLKVSSTPTFFINGKVHRGSMSIEQIEKEIQPYLKAS